MTSKKSKWLKVILVSLGILACLAVVVRIVFSDDVQQIIKTALYDYIRTKTEEAVSTSSKGKVHISIGEIEYGFYSQVLEVRNIRVTVKDSAQDTAEVLNIHLPLLTVTKLSPYNILTGSGVHVGKIQISDASVSVITKTAQDSAVVVEKDTTIPFRLPKIPNIDSTIVSLIQAAIPKNVKPLSVELVEVQNANIKTTLSAGEKTTQGSFNNVQISIANIHFDEKGAGSALNDVRVSATSWERVTGKSQSIYISKPTLVVNHTDTLFTVDSLRYQTDSATSMYGQGIVFSYTKHILQVDSFLIKPTYSDDHVFDNERYNSDRFIISGAKIRFTNIDFNKLELGKGLAVHNIRVENFFIDILSNKRKPNRKLKTSPAKPHQIFAQLPFEMSVDSVIIANAGIHYGEDWKNSSKPAELYWSNVHCVVTGLTNITSVQKNNPLTITAEGTFLSSATMNATISIPLDTNKYILHARGAMYKFPVQQLNVFLPAAENLLIKSGYASRATFDFTLVQRKARGNVRAEYTNMKFTPINKKSKKASFWDGIAAFVANWVVIKNDNVIGEDFTVGTINYTMPNDAALMQTLWFPIRQGLGTTAGF